MSTLRKTPVETVIALNLDAGTVRVIYYRYWELKGMYELARIYDELRANSLLGLLHTMYTDDTDGNYARSRILYQLS